MTIDLTAFYQAFFEESLEMLGEMERVLLEFDVSAPDNDKINQLFRAVHTIKGNSATFGFTPISEFTHSIETLIGLVRANNYALKKTDVTFLLEATDCIRAMVSDLQNNREIDQINSRKLSSTLNKILGIPTEEAPAEVVEKKDAITESIKSDTTHDWRINFHPAADLFQTNSDFYQLFKMLQDLGELEAIPDIGNLPAFNDIDVQKCYLKWVLMLRNTNATEQDIHEIFEWIKQDTELKIEPITSATEKKIPIEVPVSSALAASAPPKAVFKETATDKTEQAPSTIRISVDKIDALINIVGELIITQSILDRESEQLNQKDAQHLLEGLEKLNQNCRELQDKVMRVRMVPISFAFSRFHRTVHDLAIVTGKQVELRISGEQTEIDKTMMEKLIDPLTHLVRNSIDHGLETPEKRLALGKPAFGTIELSASQKGGRIIIAVSDDGAGLNKERILQKAMAQHLIDEKATLTDEQIYDLIFQPGFSTAEKVTEISGRGVGMDVVRQNIEELHGTITLSSKPGEGSCVTLTFPLTLAIMDCQLVAIGQQTYIIPLISITEIIKIEKENIHNLEVNSEFYYLRGEYIPIIHLAKQLSIAEEKNALTDKFIIVVNVNDHSYGLVVDDMLSQQQVVIKNLEDTGRKSIGVSGATVLGDGSVALILDINGLVASTHIPLLEQRQITAAENSVSEIKPVPKLTNTVQKETQFLIFKLGENEYGINMVDVVEIRDLSKITEVPGTVSFLSGVINLRGIIVPIMNLSQRFNMSHQPNPKPSVVILKVIYEHKQKIMGMLVDAVSDTCYANECVITETPDYESAILKKYIQGIITLGDRMIAVLDAERLVVLEN